MNNELTETRTQLSELSQSLRAMAENMTQLAQKLSAVDELLLKLEALQNTPPAPDDAGDANANKNEAESAVKQAQLENAEFMKTAIHELRTPMTSIRGYSDMLSNPGMAGELNEMQSQLLKVVRSNSRRMENLLTDMSHLNKIRAGIVVVNKKMDMFKNIAMRVEKDAQPMAEELNRQLAFDIPQGLPLLNTDGDLMSVALLKLIENSLRYSPPETGKVRVSGHNEDNRLVITIADNGIGMDAETLGKIGTLYFRADDDLVRSYKGSGLGVAIAYGLIEALEGHCQVTSTPGQGTTFTLSFPGMS